MSPSFPPAIHDRLNELQEVRYAESRRSLLVVVQAMDTGGKDGLIRKVFGPLNPQGVRVTNFKSPSEEELAHDFLWRVHRAVPRKGMIGIFNRSHYEDVLIVRVHDLVSNTTVKKRYRQINQFERYLTENDVTVLKFYLHISKDEQKERLQKRLDKPDKHWKFSSADLDERKLWDDYVEAYQTMLGECSTPAAPWYIIPANHKWYRDYAVSQIVRDTLEGMKLQYPPPEDGLDGIKIPD
jgi:PPK2 family polyphosphate:nucleotide phosphotransferase